MCANLIHDIGMQCADIELLREVGAKIEHELPAAFTPEEQAEVRKHHNELSARMVVKVRQGSEPRTSEVTGLESAVLAIPAQFIEPMTDVARHHSSSADINGCEEGSRETFRQRLLALYLRMADELDITSARVNMDQVRNFPRPHESEYWWWVHLYTAEITIKDHSIVFHLQLAEEDRPNENVLETAIVKRFFLKNRDLIDRLREYGLALVQGRTRIEYRKYFRRLDDAMRAQVEGVAHEVYAKELSDLQDQMKRDLSPAVADEILNGLGRKKD